MTARFYNENTARFTRNTAPFYNDPRFLPFIGLLLENGDICEIPFNKCVRGHRPIISAAIKMWKIRWKHFFLNLVEETGWRIWRQHQLLDLRKSFRTACTFNEGGTLSKMTSSLSGTTHLCLNICKQNSVPRTLHWIHVQFGHSNEWTLLVLTLF